MSGHGLYSEVDGQTFAWIGKFLIGWGKPFDMNTLNPFEGMGSVFIPVNSWWNPGAFVLGLPTNKLISFVLSYSIYWIEIFFSIYFLAKTTGLNKIESILAAELYVLFLFPPFSAYFNTSPIFSLVPLYAHLLASISLMTITYAKLGESENVRNLFLVFFFALAGFIVIMSTGFGFVPAVPIYTLLFLGFTIQNFNRQQLLWKMGALSFLACLFFIMHGSLYYEGLLGYIASSARGVKAISFALPKIWQKHTSIFYGPPPLVSFLHIFALLGGLIGIFCQRGKYRWIAISFVLIVLLPDVVGFFFENGIISGTITNIGISYYVWNAYPLYCIFFIIFISFLWRVVVRTIEFLANNPFDFIKANSTKITVFHSVLHYLKLLIPLIIIPVLGIKIWFGNFYENRVPLIEPSKTPIVAYLENKIGLKPGDTFRGTTAEYFASKNSPLRQINYQFEIKDGDSYYTANHYITAREFLNRRFKNRHMLSDLWNYNIPTLEEYAHLVSKPMYFFFNKMLANEGDVAHGLFLNIYKLNLKVLRAMGVRYLISDKNLHEKDLSLVMIEKQTIMSENSYTDFNLSISAKKVFEELEEKYKHDIISSAIFKKEFKNKLDKIHPAMQEDKEKIFNYLDVSINSALVENPDRPNWSHTDLEKIKNIFKIVIFSWAVSPPLYLYEIKSPNLATFSPIHIIKANSGKELFFQMAKSNFSFEKSVVVQEAIPTNIANHLVKAINSKMGFERNAVRVESESAGWSILLLPLQYSHCFRVIEMAPSSAGHAAARLIRANLIHAALLFKGKMDVKLSFVFGIGRNTHCRAKDMQDLQTLGLLDEQYLYLLHKRAVKDAGRIKS